MSTSKIIFFAIPIFFILMLIEWLIGLYRAKRGSGRNTYRLSDTINSLSLGIASQLYGILTGVVYVGVYTGVYHLIGWTNHHLTAWDSVLGFIIAVVFYDFCYYWYHRGGHRVAILWASHSVHHQSQHYNLSTALRQTSTGNLLLWIFYLPMAILGVPPYLFVLVAMVNLLYQFWVHTEQVSKLGWFDYVFCSPSNHRVHHGINQPYLDKNYGGIFIIWDRLFGTFQEETEKPVFGTLSLLNSWDPAWANWKIFQHLLACSWKTHRFIDKFALWVKPPDWQPTDLAQSEPLDMSPDITRYQLYDPTLRLGQIYLSVVHFVAVIAAFMGFLWFADTLNAPQAAIWIVALSLPLWATGAYIAQRIHWIELVTVDVAALAILTGLDFFPGIAWYPLLKPLTVSLLTLWVLVELGTKARQFISKTPLILLAIGLAFGALGDYFLLKNDSLSFMLGLASFLIGHIFYLVLLKRGQKWFPNKWALLLLIVIGLAFYLYLWPHLESDLVMAIAVAFYIVVLVLMGAQAIGRANIIGSSASVWVAIGAVSFILSDILVAYNHFVTPISYYGFFNLTLYYYAQFVLAHNACQTKEWALCSSKKKAQLDGTSISHIPQA